MSKTWDRVNQLRAEVVPGARALKLTPARRRHLKARISEHGPEAVVAVWRWALTSSASRAAFLREQGFVRPDTLHRASKFPGYLDLAREPATPEARRSSAGGDLDTFLADDDRTTG